MQVGLAHGEFSTNKMSLRIIRLRYLSAKKVFIWYGNDGETAYRVRGEMVKEIEVGGRRKAAGRLQA